MEYLWKSSKISELCRVASTLGTGRLSACCPVGGRGRIGNGDGPTARATRVPTPQRIRFPELLSNGVVRLSFGDASGQGMTGIDTSKFEVSAASSVTSSNWTRLTNAIVFTNGVLRLDDTAASGQTRRFYRVLENP